MRPSQVTTSVLTALALAGLTSAASAQHAAVLVTELELAVQGLEQEQSALVERAFGALTTNDDPPRKLLESIDIDVEEKHITLAVVAGGELSLTQIQRALAAGKARLDPTGVRIHTAALVIRAPAGEEDHTDALERVLRAKVAYSEVTIERDAEASVYRAQVMGGSERATLERVRASIAAAGEGLSLAEVHWSSPEAP